jgi:hypothetical protein
MLRLNRSSAAFAAIALAAGVGLVSLTARSTSTASAAPAPTAEKLDTKQVDFAKDVQPILKDACVRCHKAPDKNAAAAAPGGRQRGPAGGLRLDDKDALLKGGKHGKAVVPGKGDDSPLYKILKGSVTMDNEEIDAMPKPKKGEQFKPLADEKQQIIKAWIDQGAK